MLNEMRHLFIPAGSLGGFLTAFRNDRGILSCQLYKVPVYELCHTER
jgi:hypothetical protein